MANKTKITTTLTADVEFEPYSEWQKDDGSETLVLHLPDFKKDQLRVEVNNLGVLKVSGARPIDGGSTSRFLKETKVPQGCDVNDIRAKFMNSCLHVLMPKKVAAPPQVQDEEQGASTASASPQVPEPEAPEKAEAKDLVAADQNVKSTSANENGKMERFAGYGHANDNVFGIGRSIARLHVGKKVSVSFGMAMLGVVAIGIYAAYKCGTETSCSSPSLHIEDYIQN